MDTLNPPDAIHGNAIDLACEGDRVWFEQNPDRQHRLRDMMPFENNGPMELPPYGMTWKILVTQIKSGMRFRMPVAMSEDLPTDGNDESLAPPKAKTLIEPEPAKSAFEISWPNVVRIDHMYRPQLVIKSAKVKPLQLNASQTAKLAELAPILEGKPDVTKVAQIDLDRLARGVSHSENYLRDRTRCL